MALIDFAAAPETCCDIIPLAKLSKGSIFSASPSGENSLQWFFSTSGLILSSTLIKWAPATSSKLSVVILVPVGFLDGDSGSIFLDATTLDVSGDKRVALVARGSANLATVAFRGFEPAAGSNMTLAALGVGVNGGAGWTFCVRRFVGVTGGAVALDVEALRFRLF